ncbi:zf-HC2 domain-containing protein [Kitasatospora sp. LaBMicrA B282]|uniref:zf-HC2 domain-containing protein n=1 Tax=Kitasatospora sp. LaBMicrA B282 TaxID=3420949 RepID=UPI003D13C409
MSGAGRSGAKRPAPAEQQSTRQAVPVLRPITVRRGEPPQAEEHLGDRLTAYLDGELGHDDRERVQAHLATCEHCLHEADEARSVKQLLTGTAAPGPSGLLMARLMAVAAQPDDLDGGSGGPSGTGRPAAEPGLSGLPTLGGSRLTGGSFGRGAGASFGRGAGSSFGRGAGSSFGRGAFGGDPVLPEDAPELGGRGGESRLWGGRRTGNRPAGPGERRVVELLPRTGGQPRGRRLVVAAAGAFSVAAVTLGGIGSLGLAAVAGDSPVEEQHGSVVNPQVPGSGPVGPVSAPLTVDLPFGASGAHTYDLLTPGPGALAVNPVIHGHVMRP